MAFDKNYTYFQDREGRAAFIAKTFQKQISSSKNILDVGCDYNTLKKIIGPKVTGVDLYGEPDIVIDFEKDKLSKFKDNSYDTVVCTEVLEHLDNLHEMAEELWRVSRRYIIVSLPNCLSIFTKWNIIFHGRVSKYYGLPFTRPEDRHRWFFSYKDIDRFWENFCRQHKCKIRQKFLQLNFSDSWRGKLMRQATALLNMDNASQSYWVVIEKGKPEVKR